MRRGGEMIWVMIKFSISMYIMCVILYIFHLDVHYVCYTIHFPSRCTLCVLYYTFSISMYIMCVILYIFHLDVHYVCYTIHFPSRCTLCVLYYTFSISMYIMCVILYIFHLDVHYVCYTVLVQHFEPQCSRCTNVHYYYYYLQQFNISKHGRVV